MATVEVTRRQAWGVIALLILLIIIFALYWAGKELMNTSRDSEMQKLTTAVTSAVGKMSLQNKTIGDIDGAVKEIPSQLREAISNHEERRFHLMNRAATHRRARLAKPPTKMVAEVKPQKIETVDKVAIASKMIDACDKLGGTLITKGGNVVCDIKEVISRPKVLVDHYFDEGFSAQTPQYHGAASASASGAEAEVAPQVQFGSRLYTAIVDGLEAGAGVATGAGLLNAIVGHKAPAVVRAVAPGPVNPAPGGPPVVGGPVAPLP